MLTKKSFRSIDILEKKVNKYFEVRDSSISIFCDNCDLIWRKEEVTNVLLMGTALLDIFYADLWPERNYKIWVLNNRMRSNLIKLIGLPKECVGVINRYELFPISIDADKYDLDSLSEFIFSSRAMTLKNFNIAYEFVNQLACKFNTTLTLKICSQNFKEHDYTSRIIEKENVKLSFLGDLGEEWHETKNFSGKEILLQFSVDPFDDFNVSVAQWQQQGRKVLCINSSAFSDLTGNAVKYIDPQYIVQAMNDGFSIELLDNIYDNKKIEISHCKDKIEGHISKSDLLKLIEKVDEKSRIEINNLNGYEFNKLTRKLLYD